MFKAFAHDQFFNEILQFWSFYPFLCSMTRKPNTIDRVRELLDADRGFDIKDSAAAENSLIGIAHTILYGDQGLSQKSARWIPRFSQLHKRQLVEIARDFIRSYKGDIVNFRDSLIIVIESSVL